MCYLNRVMMFARLTWGGCDRCITKRVKALRHNTSCLSPRNTPSFVSYRYSFWRWAQYIRSSGTWQRFFMLRQEWDWRLKILRNVSKKKTFHFCLLLHFEITNKFKWFAYAFILQLLVYVFCLMLLFKG